MDNNLMKKKQVLLEAADEEKLHLIEGGIEQVVIEDDGDDNANIEGALVVTAQDKTLSKKLVQKIQNAVESSFTEE
jgi:hypothetical protein